MPASNNIILVVAQSNPKPKKNPFSNFTFTYPGELISLVTRKRLCLPLLTWARPSPRGVRKCCQLFICQHKLRWTRAKWRNRRPLFLGLAAKAARDLELPLAHRDTLNLAVFALFYRIALTASECGGCVYSLCYAGWQWCQVGCLKVLILMQN